MTVASKDIAENTYLSYQNAIKKHLIPAPIQEPEPGQNPITIGEVLPQALTVQQIEHGLSTLVKGEKGKRTRQNCYVVLKCALAKGVKWGYLEENPCEEIDKPKAPRKKIFPFDLAESKRIIEAVSDNVRDSALYRLALTTGMRQGEIFGLHWDALNLDEATVSVHQQATQVWNNLRVKVPKSKTSIRVLELTPEVVLSLRKYLDSLQSTKFADCQMVFPNEDGSYLRNGSFGRWCWSPLLQRLKLKHRGFHHLRHTAATLMLTEGVEVPVVTKILGQQAARPRQQGRPSWLGLNCATFAPFGRIPLLLAKRKTPQTITAYGVISIGMTGFEPATP